MDLMNINNALAAYQQALDTFKPVRCHQSDIDYHKIAPEKGWVYFTLDSQRIYYGTGTEFLPMGGNSGISYAHKTFDPDDNSDIYFSISDFDEGSPIPNNINDLIINVGGTAKRNGFYQVTGIDHSTIITRQLSVGGGGYGEAATGNISITYHTPAAGNIGSLREGTDYYIQYNVQMTDSSNEPYSGQGKVTWIINNKAYDGGFVSNGVSTPFNIGPYLSSTFGDGGKNTIKVRISATMGGATSVTREKDWEVTVISLKLKWEWQYHPDNYIKDDEFTFKYIPTGTGVSNVKLRVWFYSPIFDRDQPYEEVDVLSFGTELPILINFSSSYFGHGVCDIYMQLIADECNSDIIHHKITIIKDSKPILTVPFYALELQQYNTVKIPFLIYNPLAEDQPQTIIFKINDEIISQSVYSQSQLNDIIYAFSSFGEVKLTLQLADSDILWEHNVTIKYIAINVTQPPKPDYILKSSEIISNEQLQKLAAEGQITFSENFDWINGGIKTETDKITGAINKFILIKNGTTMTINHKLFAEDAKKTGKSFKFIYKAMNCYDYDAQVLSCIDQAETPQCDFIIRAQDATLTTNSILETNHITTSLKENTYTELELDIWKEDSSPMTYIPEDQSEPIFIYDNYVIYWVDGVPTKAEVYYNGGTPFQQVKPSNIVIGSNDCDVAVYLVKIYDKELSHARAGNSFGYNDNDHISSFILDAPNGTEMLARFNRNNILDNNGDISYIKLVAQNPGCHAFLYEIPRMTKNKNDPIVASYAHYYSDTYIDNNDALKTIEPLETATNVEVKVQGTSSAFYGVAAFNIDSNFTEGFVKTDGTLMDKYAISETAIPVKKFCTKVNVASCENANNAINQEWYHKFQPYHDAHRRQQHSENKEYRDCMEFIPGVLFIKDTNDKGLNETSKNDDRNIFWDSADYMSISNSNKPYLQYAICNMGNTKKNTDIFHLDYQKNPSLLVTCVEITNNNSPEHEMLIADLTPQQAFGGEKPFYEFRYPDEKNFDYSSRQNAFLRLVNWFANGNPNKSTNQYFTMKYIGKISQDKYISNTYFTFNFIEQTYQLSSTYNANDEYYEVGTSDIDQQIVIKFNPYTFKGFNPPGYENASNPSGVSLKGIKISDYAEQYTQDTFNYRMALMLQQCEDYLVMDSIVYHYLFIERHSMVDNVAKNTFWSTEDGIHWDLTKNYDNDTADGNDNTGYLTLDYGVEVGDYVDEKPAFNASRAVWLNFVKHLPKAQENLYQQLDTKGAWDVNSYLQAFEKFQSVIPERCWMYDYFRKYIRPRQIGADNREFFQKLDGGKKTKQRNRYETYQNVYYGSKQKALGTSDKLSIRLKAEGIGIEEAIIPLTYYIDCYSWVEVGGKDYHKRWKRSNKEPAIVNIYDLISSANMDDKEINLADATCDFRLASYIQTIDNLAPFKPYEVSGANASRLRKIVIGSDAEGYRNENIQSVALTNNTMLEYLDLQNVGSITTKNEYSLDLSNSINLKTLYINGSSVDNLILANRGRLQTAKINDLRGLTAKNLQFIETIEFESSREEDVSDSETKYRFNTLIIHNTPTIDTYDFIMHSKLNNYSLQGVNWVISDLTQVTLDETGTTVIGINILDKLAQKIAIDGGLEGVLTLDLEAKVDEYLLYSYYKSLFPNLKIETRNMQINPAMHIKFYENDENDKILYDIIIPINGVTTNIKFSDLVNWIQLPFKNDTPQITYLWNNEWAVFNQQTQSNDIYQHSTLLNISPEVSFIDNYSYNNIINIRPNFTSQPKTYNLILKTLDKDGNLVTYKEFLNQEYNTAIELPRYVYRENSTMHQRWSFKGWVEERYFNSENALENLIFTPFTEDAYYITKNIVLYAYFIEEDCFKIASDIRYFNIDYDTNGQSTITIKDQFKSILAGKITFPAKHPSTNRIFNIVGSSNLNSYTPNIEHYGYITHIYFEEHSEYTIIDSQAFYSIDNFNGVNAIHNWDEALLEVYLPITITEIRANAFRSQVNLTYINLSELHNLKSIGLRAFSQNYNMKCSQLPENLEEIGNSAFYENKELTIQKLPETLSTLSSWAFGRCNKSFTINFSLGSFDTQKGLKTLEQDVFFMYDTTNRPNSLTITLNPSIINASTQVFHKFINSNDNDALKIYVLNESAENISVDISVNPGAQIITKSTYEEVY